MIIEKKIAIQVLNEALSTGADYAEIYYQDNLKHSYVRRYKQVEGVTSARTCGVGIRLLEGNKVVYGYTSDLTPTNLINLAKDLSLGLEGKRLIKVTDLKEIKSKNANPIRVQHSQWSTSKKLDYLQRGEEVAYSVSDKIKDVVTSLNEEDEYVEIYNSDQVFVSDTRCRTRMMVTAIATDGIQFQSGSRAPGLSCGLELLEDNDFEKLAYDSAKEAVDLLDAIDGPSGEMPVVLGNHFGGVLFHEACGHPLEGSAISRKQSPFADKLGEMIASSCVTAIDDGTISNGWGSETFDDEGIKPSKNILIQNGKLVNYMVDRYTSRRIPNSHPTGSCRRQNYTYIPTTRMTNTYIDNGSNTVEEVIASVKNGIYCKGFTGGQVDPSTDQFVFTSDVAYTIKDGKIDKMVKPISLIGYGYEILQRITMVANDLKRAPGSCGAASGMCNVEVGQPTLAISKITVGGRGE